MRIQTLPLDCNQQRRMFGFARDRQIADGQHLCIASNAFGDQMREGTAPKIAYTDREAGLLDQNVPRTF